MVSNRVLYMSFLSDTNKYHYKNFSVTEDMKEKATTMAKIQAMRTFFVIGILEQFEDTLKVFETILPSYYSGVLDIWQSDSKLIYSIEFRYFLKHYLTL